MSDKDPKVVDLNQQRTKIAERLARQERFKQTKNRDKNLKRGRSDLHWYHYLQFFFLLAVIFYGMTLCQR